ncbi:hypothetical protein GCM10008014_09020 [Paenibacillus silvae]|uniref:Uncharacterized protein n=1 Tax=Paenibacillus silvae TaxID=1325358 RepID=A0ABQ1Z167_9BACL|nr:hypothetical protein [Paenibacillus silvae]GGH46383.1 hypothetical protein GCM10008014_09020 [Paenibacillus silvae]
MNFLEQLASEYYTYRGNFVRTNIKFNKRTNGGYDGEIDVLAFDTLTNSLTHIETSTDAQTIADRKVKFARKFNLTLNDYNKILNTSATNLIQIAVVGFTKTKIDFGAGIVHKTVPEFIKEINGHLDGKNPMKEAVPESFLLLRAIQFSNYYK